MIHKKTLLDGEGFRIANEAEFALWIGATYSSADSFIHFAWVHVPANFYKIFTFITFFAIAATGYDALYSMDPVYRHLPMPD
jgi:hypothetical protein